MADESRWLLIVRSDRADLTASLALRYPDATVIVDRRRGERRRRSEPVPIERREWQRRAPLAPWEQVMWDTLGYRLVHRPARDRAAFELEPERVS